MKEINYLGLDGHCLLTFITVLEELSVSRAAERLGVTQSAVSHTLTKLRLALGDPLFVRSGRGISATAQARSLREPVRALLDDLKSLTDTRVFDPTIGTLEFTIAANDFQRDLIFPDFLRQLRAEGITSRFSFLPSEVPSTALLRNARCDLIVTPWPPEGDDIFAVRLFDMQMMCFYDAQVREAPQTWEEFRTSPYIVTRFADNATSLAAIANIDHTQLEAPQVSVSNFSALAAFIKGTDLITTEANLMARGPLSGLAMSPLPFKTDTLVMYLVWHRRDHTDPAHQWLRDRIKAAVSGVAHAKVSCNN